MRWKGEGVRVGRVGGTEMRGEIRPPPSARDIPNCLI